MRSAFAVACVPVALTLAIFAARTRSMPPSGDEPHYLIMARITSGIFPASGRTGQTSRLQRS
jgi:hypothetical protein